MTSLKTDPSISERLYCFMKHLDADLKTSMTGAHFRCCRCKSNQSTLLANVWISRAPWESDLAVCTHTSPKGQLDACLVIHYNAKVPSYTLQCRCWYNGTFKFGRHTRPAVARTHLSRDGLMHTMRVVLGGHTYHVCFTE